MIQNVSAEEKLFFESWPSKKDKHFIVYYQDENYAQWSSQVLREAERYYKKIANEIGYARYKNYWTWEDRVNIIIFSDQASFLNETGMPVWSKGGAMRDRNLFQSGMIITYTQESGFMNGVLPHEISHLILKDFIGDELQIPLWFDEGIAQLQENNKKKIANYVIQNYLKQNIYLDFNDIFIHDIRKETDPKKVSMYYAQSLSMIDFLISKYGSFRFGQLCSNLKEGKGFVISLKSAYSSIINDVEDFEKKWLNYMKNQ